MITYDNERQAWSFKDCTDDERDALMEMPEAFWPQLMAQKIAAHMAEMAMVEPPVYDDEEGRVIMMDDHRTKQ